MQREERYRQKLAARIAQGRRDFVWRFGVLGWGVMTAFLFALWQGVSQGWENFWLYLVLSLVIFPLGGVIWGRVMWRVIERQAREEGLTR
jgi:uncharacterized membrane protein